MRPKYVNIHPCQHFFDDTFSCSCQPCPVNSIQTSANTCAACKFGFRTVFSGSVVCEPCPFGMVGHLLGGCHACSPGTYRSDESSTCSSCKAGSYSGHGFPACVPCKQGEYSNGVGSAECHFCAPGTYSKRQSSNCTPCGINTASNLSMQPACPTCLSGHIAPFSGMTQCSACPNGTNNSMWMPFVPHNLKANASDAEIHLAISVIESSCFHFSGKTQGVSTPDTISTSNIAVIAIMCTVAGIIFILGSYFLRKSCRDTDCTEDSTPTAKISLSVSIPKSQVPENVRSNVMVRLGGEFFHQLLQGRLRTAEKIPSDIELCRIDACPVENKSEISALKSIELVRIPVAHVIQKRDVEQTKGMKETDDPPAQHPDLSSLDNSKIEDRGNSFWQSATLPLGNLQTEEQDCVESIAGVGLQSANCPELNRDTKEYEFILMAPDDISANTARHSPDSGYELHHRQKPSAEPQQYQGKKYSIDLENVRWLRCNCDHSTCAISRFIQTKYILRGAPRYAVKAREQHGSAAQPTGMQ